MICEREKRMDSQAMRLNWKANLSAGLTVEVPYYQRPLLYSPNKVGTIVKQDFERCAMTGKERAKEGICSKALNMAVLDAPWGQAFIHSYGLGPFHDLCVGGCHSDITDCLSLTLNTTTALASKNPKNILFYGKEQCTWSKDLMDEVSLHQKKMTSIINVEFSS